MQFLSIVQIAFDSHFQHVCCRHFLIDTTDNEDASADPTVEHHPHHQWTVEEKENAKGFLIS